MSLWRTAQLLAAGLVVAVPSVAAACPYCAQNTPESSAFGWLIGAMIFLPFPLVGAVAYVIKHGGPKDEEPQLD